MSNDVTPSPLEGGSAIGSADVVKTVLSDLSVMHISATAMLKADPSLLRDAIRRRHAARWERNEPRGLSAGEAPCAAAVNQSPEPAE